MSTLRTLTIALAAAVLVWTSSPVLAGPPGGRGDGGPSAGRAHAAATRDDGKGDTPGKSDRDAKGDQEKGLEVKGDRKDTKDKTTAGKKQADKTHPKKPSNKGGKKRGLDRADEVAGEHGKQGRANAREHATRQAGGQ